MSQQMPEIVRKYYEGINQGALDPTLFAEELHFRGVTDEYNSAQDFLKEMEATLGKMKPEIELLQAVVSSSGDEVAVRADLQTVVTELGKFRFSEWFRLEDGKISEIQLYYDPTPWKEYFASQEDES